MITANKYIIAYDSFRLLFPEELVGGKAKNLFILYRKGFRVPPWIVLSSHLFELVVEPLTSKIESAIDAIDFDEPTTIDRAASEIKNKINNLELQSEIVESIKMIVQTKLNASDKFAVRSSVVGEDSPFNSFAGQMDSFLNVSYSNLIDAIKDVWASAYSSRAIIYRHHKGLHINKILTAVIIQKMIPSVASGIMFTQNPKNRAKEYHVSAGYGLCEGVVQNLAETDTYQINWKSKEIKKDVIRKHIKVTSNNEKDGTHLQLINNGSKDAAVLSDSLIHTLTKQGRKIHKTFKYAQDIEWAFDENNKLHILQSRPIIFEQNHQQDYKIWDNSNIIESYPGLTLPLTFSFIQQCYEIAFKKATHGCQLTKGELDKDVHIFKNMIGLLNGRVYYNLLNWYKMLSYLPGFSHHKKAWDQMIGITERIELPQAKVPLHNKLYASLYIIKHLLTVEQTATSFLKDFNTSYEKKRDINFSSLSENDLVVLFRSLEETFSQKWYKTLYNDFCAMKYYDWLKKMCQKYGLDKYENLHNNLLCGERDIESVKPIHSLLQITALIKNVKEYQDLFSIEDNKSIWLTIVTEKKYLSLKKLISTYLQEFGDRSLEELKLEVSTFREEPERLIAIVKSYLQTEFTVQTLTQKENRVRKNAEKIVCATLKNPFKRLLFQFVLKNTRLAVANRENMRFARSRLYGLIRRLFHRIGVLFMEKNLIENSKDIHYLTVSEIFDFIQGNSVNQSFQELIAIRKKDYEQFEKINMVNRFCHTGIPYLHTFDNITHNSQTSTLKGIGCSSGIQQGIAKVITDPKEIVNEKDYILVAKSTDPGWIFLMLRSKGIIVERGSVLSHTAIIGRELGIPTIVAVDNATNSIKDGMSIQIDGSTGVVQCL